MLLLIAAVAVAPIVRSPTENKSADQSKAANEKTNAKADAEASNTPPPSASVCRPAEGKTVEPWCEPVRVIRDFFLLDPGLELTKEKSLRQIEKAAAANRYKLRFLVALVPDPIDSNPPISFDLALDAIQKGFGRAGYRPDRVWLPWTIEAGKPGGVAEPLYRTTPGLLLFRLPPKEPSSQELSSQELAIVFLVGESPKSGIQKRAFDQALTLASGLRGAGWTQEVGILGPSFSGSVDSLLIALQGWSPSTYKGPL
ncbi:MAG TPA: hypothetical protein VIJ61_12630, partial [Thermoanaerobaculia bacterium]